MPQYQGVWTLPVAARLQSTQQWATDPLYRNTTLLLQADNAANGAQNNTFLDSSTNNFTITRNGNTTQGTFTPFSQSPGWWGNYFDGTGDYLSAAANAAFQFGTGNFTIEFWYYPTSFGTNTPIDMGYANTGSYVIQSASDGKPYFYSGTTGIVFTATTGYTLNAWNHLAVTRSGTTLSMFINGARVGSATNSTNFNANFALGIGGSPTHSTAYEVVGYMSNVRLIKGTAIYDPTQSTITVPTSPLTAITNTSLLTCQSNRFSDNSTNAFAITVAGNSSVQAFSPFAPQYQYTPSVTGGSGYFDGTGDYLTAPDDVAMEFGSGAFTVECWFYGTTSLSNYEPLVAKNSGVGTNNAWVLQTNRSTANTPAFVASSGTTTWNVELISSTAYVLNTWNHLAAARSGNTFSLFLNGVRVATTTSSITLSDNAEPTSIGAFSTGNLPFRGYISNARVVKGTAVYDPTQSTITVPTAPLTAITNTSLLCNFTNAGIYDGTLKNNLETVGNAQVSTSVVKYGTGSMAFDGTGDYLTSNAVSGLALYSISATESFTIEMWINRSGNGAGGGSGYDAILGSNTGATAILGVYVERSTLKIGFYIGGALYLTSSTISNSAWTHIAVARNFGNLQIFINGVSGYSAANSGASTLVNPLYIGQDGTGATGNNNFNGYIDDLRITKGIARYTANFTPPTVALPRQ